MSLGNPGKYLGLLMVWERSKTHALKWIQDKVYSNLMGWSHIFLSLADKETLIKAIVQDIPSYAMSILLFPKNLCAKLCSMVPKF